MSTQFTKHAVCAASMLLAISLSFFAPPAQADGGWEQLSQKDGVTIERRPHPGTSFYELRARAVCPVRPKNFFDTVWSYRDYPAFVPYLRSLKVLGEQGDSSTLYQQIAMPLVSDRDYTIEISRVEGGEGQPYEVRFESADKAGPPPDPAFVRAQNIRGGWKLEPLDGGRATQITYELYSEPGGAVPTWIVNLAQKDAPRALVLAMMQRAIANAQAKTASKP